MSQSLIINNYYETELGPIPKVDNHLSLTDKWQTIKVRWAINRFQYKINPGLYAVGQPDKLSPIFVSANFKLSFDSLRKNLPNIDGWILVLDTKGINVWCAAGKGTFGTKELVKRIKEHKLDGLVSHNRIIVPQLGAPGIAAHEVKEQTGFKIIYGPVNTDHISDFLSNGMKSNPQMRRVRFNFLDRITLIPVELVVNFKYLLYGVLFFLLLSGFAPNGFSFTEFQKSFWDSLFMICLGFLSGIVFTPALLPYIPARSFAIKGAMLGLVIATLFLSMVTISNIFFIIAWFTLIPAFSSYLALNFTGTSTYTSLSGVLLEMKYAIPILIAVGGIGCISWILGKFII